MLLVFAYSTLAAAGVLNNMSGNGQLLLWVAHISILMTMIIYLFCSDFLVKIFEYFFGNPSGCAITLFLSYYLFAIILVFDISVLGTQLRTDFIRYCVPALALGFFCAVSTRQYDWVSEAKFLRWLPLVFSVVAIAILYWVAAQLEMGAVEHRFKFPSEFGSGYQSLSSYLLTAFATVAAILLQNMTSRLGVEVMRISALVIALIFFAGISALSGSKKEVLAMFLIALLFYIFVLGRDLRMGQFVFKASLLLVCSILLSVAVLFSLYYVFGLPQVSVLNYGAGINIGSLMGRWEILTEYGLLQLAVDPIFGRVNAENVVGANLYVHSLLSIQTHLGLIGVMLFLFFLAWSWFSTVGRSMEKTVIVLASPVLFVCLIGSFFTWYPLWFVSGVMVAASSAGIYKGARDTNVDVAS